MKPGATGRATSVEHSLVGPEREAGTDLGDHAVGDANVGAACRRAGAVDHVPPADEETAHRSVHLETTKCRSIIRD